MPVFWFCLEKNSKFTPQMRIFYSQTTGLSYKSILRWANWLTTLQSANWLTKYKSHRVSQLAHFIEVSQLAHQK